MSNPKNALIITAIITLIYAVCFTAIKAGLVFSPPLLFAGLRASGAGILLLFGLFLWRKNILPSKHVWITIFLVGITTTTIGYGGMFLSPGRTGAGIASVLGSMQPLFVIVLAALFLGEPITKKTGVILLLGIIGIFFISYPDLFGKGAYGITGPLLALGASGGTALGNIFMKNKGGTFEILRITAWQFMVGSLPLLAVSFFTENVHSVVWNNEFLGILFFLAILGTALPTAIWYLLIQKNTVGDLSLLFYLVPVFGLFIASFVFQEELKSNEIAGIVTIFLGIVILAADSLKSPPNNSQK